MALPDEFLQELRLRNDITNVISGYVNLKKRGRNPVGLCPFHNEKTPSFTVYPETDSFYCFGCGAGGDVIGFIKRIENLDYIDAVKLLAERAGMEMPQQSYDDSMQKLKLRVLEANREAARFFYSQLTSEYGRQGLEYLHGRALSDKTIRSFGLGFALDKWSALTDYLVKKGFNNTELIQANLSVQTKNGGIIDRFRNRVMFPIIDVRGNVIAFGGRIMTDEKPKYLNTSDTPAFKKSQNLFALNRAKNVKSDKLILCEGYMDVIALHQAGFGYAVATLGTALTKEQAVIIKRYTDTVVICYDADEAGQKATQRAIEILRKEGLNIRVLTVPDGKDPDEFIKKHGSSGAYRFGQLIEGTGNDFDYRISKLKNECDTNSAEGRVKFLTGAARILAQMENHIERSVYIGKLCQDYGVERKDVENEISKYIRMRSRREDKQELERVSRELSMRDERLDKELRGVSVRALKAEQALIAYLIVNTDMVRSVYDRVPPERLVSEFDRRVYTALTSRVLSGRSASFSDISDDFDSEENSRIAAMLAKNSVETNSLTSCGELVDIIIKEGENKNAAQLAQQSPEEIQAYLDKLKDGMKKK